MKNLKIHAAITMIVTFKLSLLYEIWRSTIMAGTSEFDNMQAFWELSPLYIVATVVILALFKGYNWASWAGFIFSKVLIGVSIFYYNPVMMIARKPEMIDWFEDFAYTGLLFVTATMLFYDIKEKNQNILPHHA